MNLDATSWREHARGALSDTARQQVRESQMQPSSSQSLPLRTGRFDPEIGNTSFAKNGHGCPARTSRATFGREQEFGDALVGNDDGERPCRTAPPSWRPRADQLDVRDVGLDRKDVRA